MYWWFQFELCGSKNRLYFESSYTILVPHRSVSHWSIHNLELKKNSIGEFLRAQYTDSKSEFRQVTVIVIIHNIKITLQCSAGKLWFLVLTLTLLQNKHTLTALASGSIGQHALRYCKTCSGMAQGSWKRPEDIVSVSKSNRSHEPFTERQSVVPPY